MKLALSELSEALRALEPVFDEYQPRTRAPLLLHADENGLRLRSGENAVVEAVVKSSEGLLLESWEVVANPWSLLRAVRSLKTNVALLTHTPGKGEAELGTLHLAAVGVGGRAGTSFDFDLNFGDEWRSKSVYRDPLPEVGPVVSGLGDAVKLALTHIKKERSYTTYDTVVQLEVKDDDTLTVIGSDGFRLVATTLEGAHGLLNSYSLALKPAQALVRLGNDLALGEEEGKFLIVGAGNVRARLLNAEVNYPDWRRGLPQGTFTLSTERAPLREALKRAQLLSDPHANNRVDLLAYPDKKLLIVTGAGAYGSSTEKLTATFTGELFEGAAFNANFLLDQVGATGDADYELSGSSPLAPMITASGGVQAMVVPLRTG